MGLVTVGYVALSEDFDVHRKTLADNCVKTRVASDSPIICSTTSSTNSAPGVRWKASSPHSFIQRTEVVSGNLDIGHISLPNYRGQ